MQILINHINLGTLNETKEVIVVESANCSCSDFVDMYGYGNCLRSWAGRVMCYVTEPSTCIDAIYWPEIGKNYSYNACSKALGKCYVASS